MFDPEKVERLIAPVVCLSSNQAGTAVVLAHDYDQLLEIHLRHVGMIADLFKRCGEPLSEDKIVSLKNGTWH